jgi:uncharacterized membrane protein
MNGAAAPSVASLRSLIVMLLITTAVFMVGAIQKAPCADRDFAENGSGVGVQCYSDVGVLLYNEQLVAGRLPYLDPCAPSPTNCDEYPPVTMYTMRVLAGVPGGGDPYRRFYWVNAALLLVCALMTTACLARVGGRAEMFAAAPVLAIYGTMNWDLIPVALTAVATVLWLRKRDVSSGVVLGIAVAAKVFPGFVLIAFIAQRLVDRDRTGARRLGLSAAVTWAVINLPFAVLAPTSWSSFFRFNADRLADHGTLWHVWCAVGPCPSPRGMDVVSAAAIVIVVGALWATLRRRRPDFPRWTMVFPMLVVFFATSKVSSSQYILWILPWFCLTARAIKPYLAEQAAEVLVYITIFSFFAGLQGGSGVSYPIVAVSLLLRAAALITCLIVWYRGVTTGREPIPLEVRTEAVTVSP